MKSITFLLPSGTGLPAGGPKVVFEYANRFVADGYQVHIVMPASLLWWECSLKEKVKAVIRFPYAFISKRHLPYKWFELDRKVKLHYVLSLHQCFVPKTEVYIATAIETSEYLNSYKGISADNKFYFVQHFEDWTLSSERVKKSYTYSLGKIVIAKWLKDIINEGGNEAELVENGFDFSEFKLTIPIERKDRMSVTMLYHPLEKKGCVDGLRALEIVKRKYPFMKLCLFGYPPRPENLPKWIEYHQKPDKQIHVEIYNKSAIFLGTSHFEGWGLTIGEAMMCGSAIVCTDNGGYAEMIKDMQTGLMSPIKNPEGLADNIIKLVENDELRCKIARNGCDFIKTFTWEKAYSKFKAIIDK